MFNSFFSERENGKKPQLSEKITVSVFNGIISIYNEYKIAMSKSFPEYCTDDGASIYGFDEQGFIYSLLSVIPDFEACKKNSDDCISYYNTYIKNSIDYISDNEIHFDQYKLLDFIEFCLQSINDYETGNFHKFFNHNHLDFDEYGEKNKNEFCDKVNRIFERNGIAFKLTLDKGIERILPAGLEELVSHFKYKTNDPGLDKLVDLALKNIIKPKPEDRQIALEKLWDAFERIKTVVLPGDKKNSANMLIETASSDSEELKKTLEEEFISLTKIGNSFQIRHHETNKIKINNIKHIDYLFYRMMSLITLLINFI